MRPFLLFLFFCMAVPLGAEPTRSFESTWTIRQSWSPGGPGTGAELTASVSGFGLSGLWVGASAGVDSGADWSGAWRSFEGSGTLRAGLQFPWGRSLLAVPWLGFGGPRWLASAGVDTEVRLGDRLHGVIGLSVASDRSVAVTVGLRDRTSWRPPVPEAPSVKVTVGAGGLALRFEASGEVPAVWSWFIEGPGGQVFYQQSGEGPGPRSAAWAGVSLWGESLASVTEYQAVFKVTDGLGRVAEARARFETGLVVVRDGGRSLVRIPRPRDEDPAVLDQLVRLLGAGRGPVTVTGHTNLVQWLNPSRAREENTREAVPETLAWAQALKDRLVSRGVASNSLTARGEGGNQPLVPFGDGDNAWKNRRVEISWRGDPSER